MAEPVVLINAFEVPAADAEAFIGALGEPRSDRAGGGGLEAEQQRAAGTQHPPEVGEDGRRPHSGP